MLKWIVLLLQLSLLLANDPHYQQYPHEHKVTASKSHHEEHHEGHEIISHQSRNQHHHHERRVKHRKCNRIADDGSPIVETRLGAIQGSILTSRLNKTIYSFRGIRYAEPPVGDLRFKPPVPVQRWSGIYNATVDGPACPQPGFDPTSEDCLFINVYTRNILGITKRSTSKWPVIFYIHSGGLYSVTGRSDWAGPQYIADQSVVFVTINYRLGSLGFISTGDHLAPGNNGLKDQVVALRWVHENIESFGGDRNSVTLYGYSMGAASVSLHLVSPMSRGLFHKAIISSGSSYGNWPVPRNQFNLAVKQARLVGCPSNTSKEIIACLKNVSAEELGNSLPGFYEFGNQPIIIWLPVIETDYGQEIFLPEHPVEMIKAGKLADVPVITGITKDEFGYEAFYMLDNSTLTEELNEDSEVTFPICFIYERGTDRSRYITRQLKTFYFGNESISNETFKGLADIFADGVIGYAVNSGVNLISDYGSRSIYYYRFSYQGRYSHFYLPGTNDTVPYGVVHHDDLIYTLRINVFPFFDDTYKEAEMVETLTTLYASFANTGVPQYGNTTLWSRFSPEDYYLDIGSSLVLRRNLYKDRYDEWARLFSQSETL